MEKSDSIKDVNGTEENEEQILPTSGLLEVDADINKEGNGDVFKDPGLGEVLGSKPETSMDNVPTNVDVEDNADVFNDTGFGETLGSKSETSKKEVPNTTEGESEVGLGVTNESGIEVSKDAELYVHEDSEGVIPENVIISEISEGLVPNVTEDSGVEISEVVEKEIILDSPVDFQMPMLTESEIVSDNYLLDQELLEKGQQETDYRTYSGTTALQGISSQEITSSSTIEMQKEISSRTVNRIVNLFVEDILNSVQNIVDAREAIITDEFSLSHTSAPSQLEIPPSDSTLSDLEVSQVCCTQEETKTVQLPLQDLRSRIVTAPSLSLENLDPDNPLMRRFQAALNAHLQRQKSRIAGELLEMEGDIRQKKKEREDLSTFLYSTQQALSRQHKSLDKDKEMIMKYFTQRQDIEELLRSEKLKHKEITKLLQAEERKCTDLQLEKDSVSAMISQFSEWETNLNSEITISQLISNKNKADKKLFTEEKLKQDMLLFNLTTEVLRLSSMFTEFEKNIKDKQADLQILTKAVIDGSVDLEALEHENKRLMQVWKVVIFRIQQRDKAFIELKTELVKAQDQYRSLVCQIESFKRSTSGEMKSNENLTETLHRLEFDIENLERLRLIDEDKQRKVREMLVQTEDMLEMTQKDLNYVMVEFAKKDKEIRLLQKEIDKVFSMKYKYEDQILNLLQTRTVNTKAAIQANRRIQELHQDCRRQEVIKSTIENNLAKTILKIEHETKAIKERQTMLDEEEAMEHERDKEIESMELEYNHLIRAIGTKETRVDSINCKVAELVAKTGDVELSPDELLIKHLEKQISENRNNIEDLKILWMREQSHIVAFKQQRSNQLHQLNIYRKQVLIMDQKYLKLDQEIEKYRKDESNMNRGIHTLEQKLASLNEQCSQRQGYKDLLENDNFVAQNQLICDLKDAEVASLTILEEMCQLEVDKEDLRKQLIETQREMLAWEKKEELAAETKQNMDSAKKEGGEIGVMKSEIHRMEVRCAQLHKVQEKLAQDMEMCVSRRDGIVDLAYAREKRSVKGAHYTRQQFIRKLDDMKSKIRQVNSEIKGVEKSIVTSEEQLKDLNTRVIVEKQQLNGLQDAVINMEAQLNEGHLHRQKNLELLVRRQHKARLYGDVKTGRYAMLIKNESALELESQKQRTINADLISIVESLNTDFPSLNNPLTQILNTLRSPAA